MKLKTKFQDEDFELGEVVDATISTTSLVDTHIKLKAKTKRGGERMFIFSRISELFEMFEDCEETKEYWGIEYTAWRKGGIEEFSYDNDNVDEFNKSIGNYFKTKEEAEKAVEKLKAWKRLRDNKFVEVMKINFRNCCIAKGKTITFEMYSEDEQTLKDLDLLFGGEE